MNSFELTVIRTEMITFRLPAVSAEDAEQRCLADGDETASKTIAVQIGTAERAD
ncbi:hypothetical protein AB0A98_06360 [Streptomyces chrestomyceticus]|uniref:hypothetical protein n=1 Tax=Streptomyces chrestomyceticus TaxID=68185 RepID=UPI0033C52948